jgi:hypothetical protein
MKYLGARTLGIHVPIDAAFARMHFREFACRRNRAIRRAVNFFKARIDTDFPCARIAGVPAILAGQRVTDSAVAEHRAVRHLGGRAGNQRKFKNNEQQ